MSKRTRRASTKCVVESCESGRYKIMFLIVVLIFSIAVVSGCIGQTNVPIKSKAMLSYESSSYGIRINYPENWVKNDTGRSNEITFKSESDNGEGQVIIVVVIPTNVTLDKYTNTSVALATLISGGHVTESKPLIVSGIIGHTITFSIEAKEKTIKMMQAWTLRNGKAYSVTYAAVPSSDFDLSLANDVINSFEIL